MVVEAGTVEPVARSVRFGFVVVGPQGDFEYLSADLGGELGVQGAVELRVDFARQAGGEHLSGKRLEGGPLARGFGGEHLAPTSGSTFFKILPSLCQKRKEAKRYLVLQKLCVLILCKYLITAQEEKRY